MVADIARITFDPTRQYRTLISQQGRVTLEADNNEAVQLASEALRLETIDIIGPVGTPDGGYAVSSGTGPGGVAIGTGILYLGGWRLQLDSAIDLTSQPDWLDAPAFTATQGQFVVCLQLVERTVCAVEDQALREPALGGPDSAARSRLMQHFIRAPAQDGTCAGGATEIANILQSQGVTIDPDTLQLVYAATLQAKFVAGQAGTDPCTPAAAGGYLGSDNQMVRVTVTDYDASSNTGTLLWGWNNASLLYRATPSDPLTLTFVNLPVDQEHAPQQNQMVEVLRAASNLGDNNYIAAGEGFVTPLAQGYSFSSQQIVLQNPLPPEYQSDPNPLFVRVWQASVGFTGGQPTALDNVSGVLVTLSLPALPTRIARRPFWHFAVRPSMPNNIYPQRYADAPQPPDGPRQWITDLAIIEALNAGSNLVQDCRVPFLPLTQQSGGCCALVLGPAEVAGRGGLQAVVASLAGAPAVLSLRPGDYTLTAPLVLDKTNNGLTIEGCTDGVVLTASQENASTSFRAGLITIDGVENITFRRLTFTPPVIPPDPPTNPTLAPVPATLSCVVVGSAAGLTVEDCTFELSAQSANTFGGGVLVSGYASRVAIRRSAFLGTGGGTTVYGVLAWVSGDNAATGMDQWYISDNRFSGLTCGAFAIAQLGLITVRGNLVTGCSGGFEFVEANMGSTSSFAREALADANFKQNPVLGQAVQAGMRADLIAAVIDKAAPITSVLPSPQPPPATVDAVRNVLAGQLQANGINTYKTLSGAAGSAASARSATAPGKVPPAVPQPADSNLASSFDRLDEVAVGAELLEQNLSPSLRIEDNEIAVTADVTTPSGGIIVILTTDEPGSTMVSGNRVVVPDNTTAACSIWFPVGAVITGNLFAQLAVAQDGTTNVPSLILVTVSPAINVSSNVNSFTELVLPARASQATTTSWEFLNTTG